MKQLARCPNIEKCRASIYGNNDFIKKINYEMCPYQLIYFAYVAGTSAFAATYLLAKGLNATQVGLLLATSNLLACFAQPIVGDIVDRLKSFVIPQLMAGIFAGVLICLSIIQFMNPPIGLFGVLYATVLFLSSITNSLNNSLCAYYTNRGCPINYGIGQGVGSFSFFVASLGFGYIMAWFGVGSMIWTVFALAISMIIVVLGYPKISNDQNTEVGGEKKAKEERVSILVFFLKYKMFVVTMFGVMLVSMCHYISENYLI